MTSFKNFNKNLPQTFERWCKYIIYACYYRLNVFDLERPLLETWVKYCKFHPPFNFHLYMRRNPPCFRGNGFLGDLAFFLLFFLWFACTYVWVTAFVCVAIVHNSKSQKRLNQLGLESQNTVSIFSQMSDRC